MTGDSCQEMFLGFIKEYFFHLICLLLGHVLKKAFFYTDSTFFLKGVVKKFWSEKYK